MIEVTTIGLDLGKNVFQVHGVDASGRPGSVPAFAAVRLDGHGVVGGMDQHNDQ
jgi:hypothetical protein